MKTGEPIDPRIPWVRVLHDLDEARAIGSPGPKLRALRRAGEKLGDELRSGAHVVSVRTMNNVTAVYPTKYAFNKAVILPVPFVFLMHRCLLVQVLAEGELRNILFNPTDAQGARKTPYFRKLIEATGERASRMISKEWPPIEEQLRAMGIGPEEIDVVAFDHFHVQDLRALPRRFPNALLLAPRREWEDWDDIHPLQRMFFIEDGKLGFPEDRVVVFDADLRLGDGCVLLQTPGHTTGNQTLFAHAEQGLARYARHYEIEVVLNSNTPELAGEQYTSMILELAMVDRVPDAPAFAQMFPSSEVTPSAIAPGIVPSMIFEKRESGTLQRGRREAARSTTAASSSTHA
jgi:glyoxylase-like metal-dependent hydrolase (beta-lactamase superfamily II)